MPRRLAGLAGLLFLVLTLATLALAPAPPAADSAPAEFVRWLSENDTGIAWSGVLYGLALLALIAWFAGAVDLVVGREEGRGLVAGSAVGLAVAVTGWALSVAIGSVAAVGVEDLDETTVLLAMSLYGAAAAISSFGFAALLGGVSLLGSRTATLPRWVTILGGVAAVVQVAGLGTLTTTSSTAFAVVWLAFALWVVWLVAICVTLLRPAPAPPT